MEPITDAEKRIMEAAEKVFYLKGKDGTSMQDIASEANITRTALNYYYRSKDKLFEAVFRSAMGRFIPKITALLQQDLRFRDYIVQLVESIIDTMIENPQIPVFVLQELSSNPSRMPRIVQELGLEPRTTLEKLKRDPDLSMLPVDPRHVIMNVISMCIFPFAARPMVLSLMYNGDEDAFYEAMQERKRLLPEMIHKMLKNS